MAHHSLRPHLRCSERDPTSGTPRDGLLSIVCPVSDDTELCGVAIFNTSVEQTRQLMDEDPGVRAGVFSYEVHPVRSFPADALRQ
jgi:hypothetical protein